jgi:hypothetical protein
MRTARAIMATSDTTPTKATMGMRLPGVAEEW